MGGKKKGGKGKKGKKKKDTGILKAFMETPEETLIRENLTEGIVFDRLTLELDLLEEENDEIREEFLQMDKDFKEERASNDQRKKDYFKELEDLDIEVQSKKR